VPATVHAVEPGRLRRRKPWRALLIVLLGVLGRAAAEAPDDRPLLFLGNKNIAPVISVEEGAPAGVAVDLVRALARHLARPVEIRALDWGEAQERVLRGEADALIQMNPSEERRQLYDFSAPLLDSQFSIFTRADTVGISGAASLRGMRVGVEPGGLPWDVLSTDPEIRLVLVPDFVRAFDLLVRHAVDAVVVDYRVGTYVVARNGVRGVKVTGEPIASSQSAIAVKKGNARLLSEIDAALRAIRADGTYDRILELWKPKEVLFWTREQIARAVAYAAIAGSVALLLLALAWIATVRQELGRRRAAEERLTKQNAVLESVMSGADAIIFSTDREYRYTSFNARHAEVMKALYGAEIEIDKSLLDYMTNCEDREGARRNLDRALAGEGVVEEAYSGGEGQRRRYFRIAHTPVRSELGEVLGVAVLAQDMTERKQAEEARSAHLHFLESMDRVNRAIAGARDLEAMMREVLDVVLSVLSCDRAFLMYPCDPEAATWQVPMERTRPEYPGVGPGVAIPMNSHVAETLLASDGPVKLGPGTSHPIPADVAERFGIRSGLSVAIRPKVGQPWHFGIHQCSRARTWTEQEERLLQEIGRRLGDGLTTLLAHRELEDSQEKLREAQRIAHIGYWDRDLLANRIELADEACRIFGIPAQKSALTLEEWHEKWLKLIHPDDRSRAGRAYAEALRGGPPYNVEYRVVRPSGEERLIHSEAGLARDESGRPYRMLGMMQDITERRRAEDEIRELNQKLEQRVEERTAELAAANRELEAFAYSVSHDLRAPLRAIDGYRGLLQKRLGSLLDEEGERYLANISDAAMRMGRLIEDLLSFSRMGRREMARLQVDLGALVKEVIHELTQEPVGRCVEWRIAELPVVTGDRAMLRVVVVNLLSNALKFTRSRERAEIEIACSPDADGAMVFSVRDNGVGFDMAYAHKLFGVFHRLHRQEDFEGTGIGLATVRRVVARHGGRTWAESRMGAGATFYFSLPGPA
jgi:PAS domain S-box-containing protein